MRVLLFVHLEEDSVSTSMQVLIVSMALKMLSVQDSISTSRPLQSVRIPMRIRSTRTLFGFTLILLLVDVFRLLTPSHLRCHWKFPPPPLKSAVLLQNALCLKRSNGLLILLVTGTLHTKTRSLSLGGFYSLFSEFWLNKWDSSNMYVSRLVSLHVFGPSYPFLPNPFPSKRR